MVVLHERRTIVFGCMDGEVKCEMPWKRREDSKGLLDKGAKKLVFVVFYV